MEKRGKKNIAGDNRSYEVLIKSLIDDIQVPYKNWKFNTNQDLKDFIMDALENIIQKEIKFKSSYRNFWRDDNTPKNEPEIQPYISNTLDHYCKVNGIQLSREPREAEGNVDILFSTRNDENELIKVCLEIKKAHHQHIETSINTQLPMYMESSDTDAGIYLVIWLKNKRHPYPEKFNSIEDLEVAVLKNNPNQNKISVKILDCCKPTSPSKIRS